MASKARLNIIDRSGEPTSMNVYLPQLTAANFDEVSGNGVGQNFGDVRIATAAVMLGNFTGHTIQGVQYNDVGTLPDSPWAQRETKIRWDYVDLDNGKKAHFTMPCPNLALLGEAGSDNVDLEEIAVAAFVSVIEANCVSVDDNAIEIVRGTIVGRRI